MLKKKLKSRMKAIIKFFVAYRIEGDERVFTLKRTPVHVKMPISKKAFARYGDLPVIKNKIIFDNYMGRGYGCNCKYVTEALLKRNLDIDIVWAVKNCQMHKEEFPKSVRLVEYGSREALKEYFTAGFWVCNYHLIAYFNRGLVKRDGQHYLQMWHGSLGIKRIEKDCDCLTMNQPWNTLAMRNSRATDAWISNSTFETEVYRQGFWDVENVFLFGHPRNDIFFRENISDITNKVKHALQLETEDRILLYVPTFREDGSFPAEKLKVSELLDIAARRFGGRWRFVIRLHPRMSGSEAVFEDVEGQAVSASAYPDIQELLASAQVVITDYSSCIFDFMLTKRPGFIFAPDRQAYDNIRGFYYPLSDTPFPVAGDMNALCRNIMEFDEGQYQADVDAFLREKGCIEDGNAAERVCDYIKELL